MSGWLVAIVAGQIGLLAVLSVVLIGHRRLEDRRARWRQAARARLAAVLRETLQGRALPEAFRHAADRAAGADVAVVLQQHAAQVHGEMWEPLTAELRRSVWFARFVQPRWRSRLWWRRLMGARMLAILGTRDDLAVAHRLIRDRHPAVRTAGIGLLRRIGDRALLEAVLEQAVDAPRVVRRHYFNTLLARPGELVGVLEERLRAPRGDYERRALLDLAGEAGAPELVEAVAAQARHGNPEIRVAVARALGGYPHPTAERVLADLLTDPLWTVRARAAASLGTVRAQGTRDALAAALGDASWWVRLRAAVALRQLGSPGIDLLRHARGAGDRFAAEMAQYVLGLGPAAVADHLA